MSPALALIAALAQQRPSVEGMVHMADPSLSSAVGTPAATAILEATSTSKIGAVRVGVQSRDFLLALTLSGPIDAATKEARPASLSGLSNSATASFALTWLSYHPTRSDARRSRVCSEYARAANLTAAAVSCEPDAVPEGRWRRRLTNAVDYGTPGLFSIKATYSRKRFDWIDTTSLAANSDREAVGSFGATAGMYSDAAGLFLISYTWEVAYSSGDPVQVCRPLGTSSATRCDDERLHGPQRDASSLVSFEARRVFSDRFGGRLVIGYRTLSDTWGVELPVYFLRNTDDPRGLAGGLSLGWRSDTRDFVVRVFSGAVLGLTGPD